MGEKNSTNLFQPTIAFLPKVKLVQLVSVVKASFTVQELTQPLCTESASPSLSSSLFVLTGFLGFFLTS